MILYHGSNLEVKEPHILMPNRFLDFGNGFYTTTNPIQAKSFADKVTARKKCGVSTVNVYELNEGDMNSLNVLGFSHADEKWLDFVSECRNGNEPDLRKNYDLIYGPVADDDIYRTFLLYSTGALTKEQTLETLKVKKLFDQYVFATEKALSFLKFLNSKVG